MGAISLSGNVNEQLHIKHYRLQATAQVTGSKETEERNNNYCSVFLPDGMLSAS